jgi:putative transposase
VHAILAFFLHLISLLVRSFRHNALHRVAAENILLRQQLLAVKRKRRRAPNLTAFDRVVFGLCAMFVSPRRLPRLAIIVSHSCLLKFHSALVKRKYSRLFSSSRHKQGPKGPSQDLIKLVLEIKAKNPCYGCVRIALLVSKLTGITVDEFLVRRILRKHYHFPTDGGPSCLSAIGNAKDTLWSLDMFRCESILLKTHWVMVVMDQYTRSIIGFSVHRGPLHGEAICCMFNQIKYGNNTPKILSTDNDPLFKFIRWKLNLEIFEIREIKSIPEVPMSHPFVERLIGTARREFLDREIFWNERDLSEKLKNFAEYYNESRVHCSLEGLSPNEKSAKSPVAQINLQNYAWKSYCNKRFSIPVAA